MNCNRLKEKNVTFSPCPTDEEIENAKKETDRQKSLEEVDPSLIIQGKRKRLENASSPRDERDKKRKVIADDDDDEEAEF